MDIYKLKNLSAEDRKLVLEEQSSKIEEQDYLRPLEDDELAILKSELAQACVQKGFIDNEFKQVKDDFKNRLKPINQQIGTAIMCLSSRMKNENGNVYLVPDYDNKMMHTITLDGTVLSSRPLKPEERQFTLSAQSAS